MQQIVYIEPEAPAKPAEGAPCNGCGVCCLAQPCPLGVVLTRRRVGACVALQWDAAARVYRCGALVEPDAVLSRGWLLRWTPVRALARWGLRRWARRWIGLGVGCDCSLEALPPS